MEGMFAPNYSQMDIDWQARCRQQERGFSFENRYATLTYKEKDSGTDYLNETSEKRDVAIEEALDWVAFKDQFFSSIFVNGKNLARLGIELANHIRTKSDQKKKSDSKLQLKPRNNRG